MRASLLAGSAAVGTSDDHSDIDLITYYDGELPDVATFDRVMRGLGAEPAGLINPPGPDPDVDVVVSWQPTRDHKA